MRNVKMADIAEACGVSIKSVSRVLNNNPNVSDEMRERVMSTIKEQGYQVNMLARGLKGNRTNIIVVFAERHHEEHLSIWHDMMLKHLFTYAKKRSMKIVLSPSNSGRFEEDETDGFYLIASGIADGAILLDQHLAHQHFQCILHLCFQRNTIIVNAGNHQADDVVHVGFDLQNIFNQEKGLQHIDGKDIFFLLFRVDITVVISADDHAAVAVVKEVLQCIIEPIERHDCPHLIVHQLHSRLFEQSQHGTFTFGQVLAGCTVGTDAGQHAGKQIKLVWNKRINLCKISALAYSFFSTPSLKTIRFLMMVAFWS